MSNSQRLAKDERKRIVLNNIAEYGWHAVNIIEDILRLAGLFTPQRCAVLLRLRTSRDFVSRRSAYTPHPCVRPTPASQAREPDSPSGLRPLARPWAKASQ
jgi:hypothetical protein